MTQTLEELKAENAAAEPIEDNQDGLLQDVEDEETDAEVEAEAHDGSEDESSETEDEDGKQVQNDEVQDEVTEGWLLDESDDDDEAVPLSAHIGLRKDLKGKLSKKDDEIEELRNQLAQLQQSQQQPVPQTAKPEPRYDDYNSDAEYQKAYMDWRFESQQAQAGQNQQVQAQQQQQAEQMRKLSESVDSHYERAEGLIVKHKIKRDLYKQSDTNVRQAVEEAVPGKGDLGVDFLISNLGEGSEKVMYAVGRNQRLLDELKGTLVADPSGFRAVAYLAKKMGEFNKPIANPKSKAPKPGAQVKGDKSTTMSNAKKKYMAAHKAGKGQEAWNIKQQAKKAGTDVSGW